MNVTEFTLYRTSSRAAGESLKRLLQGRSYMDLYVTICPYQGELHVNVGTRRPETTMAELQDMVMDLLCSAAVHHLSSDSVVHEAP